MQKKGDFIKRLATICPTHVGSRLSVSELVDGCFFGHNARALRDACHLFCKKVARKQTCVGLSLSGALVPAGLGESSIIPLIEAGLIDWIVSTGANLYHDIHGLLGYDMKMSPPMTDDCLLRDEGVIRIHNILFDQQALFDTDRFIRETISSYIAAGHSSTMSSATLNRLLGLKLLDLSKEAAKKSLVAAAADRDIPIYTPAVSDSSIGMNLAALSLTGLPIQIDTLRDVNESAAIVYDAKKRGGQSAAVIFGGGAPKNFLLQTEPHIQEVLGLTEKGHDFFMQFTDARVDTGGLSGATPSEAVTWGKIDPQSLQNTIVCYGDCSIYIPVLAAYALGNTKPREPTRLARRLDRLVAQIRKDHEAQADRNSRRGHRRKETHSPADVHRPR